MKHFVSQSIRSICGKSELELDPSVQHDLDAAQHLLVERLLDNGDLVSISDVSIDKQEINLYSVIRVVKIDRPDGGSDHYYIKRILPSGNDKDKAPFKLLEEATLLRALKKHIMNGVVEIIATFPQHLVTITKKCDGSPLSDYIGSSVRSNWSIAHRSNLVNFSGLCGIWLKRFHELTSGQCDSLKNWLRFIVGETDWRANKLADLHPMKKELFQRAAAKLEVDLRSIDPKTPCCITHGDYAPHNIFISNRNVQVLDFYNIKPGHGLMDVVNYITKVMTYGEGYFSSRSTLRLMCTEFVRRYGGIKESEKDLFYCLILLKCFARILSLTPRGKFGFLRLAPMLRRAWYLNYLQNYVSDNSHRARIHSGPWPFLDLSDVFQPV